VNKTASFSLVLLALLAMAWSEMALAQPASPPHEDAELASLLAELDSGEPAAQDRALEALVARGDELVPSLEALVVDRTVSGPQRAGAAFALGRIGAEGSEAVLRELWEAGFETLGSGLAMQVAIALAEYGVLEPLRAIVATGNAVLAAKAAIQLGLRGDDEALPALEAGWARAEYVRMRPFFAIAFGLLGDRRGETVLRAGLGVPELRNHCAVALAGVGEAATVRFDLGFALEDADPLVRLRALEGLIGLEPSNLDAVLERASLDADARVRGVAEEARQRRQRARRTR
jgi:HEAT repeat protein